MLPFTTVARIVDTGKSALVATRGAYRASIAQVAPRGAMGAYRVTSHDGASRYVRTFDYLSDAYASVAREYRTPAHKR